MKIRPFLVEEWMNRYETGARYNIAETCVDSVSLDELIELCRVDRGRFLDELTGRRLTYGDIEGAPEFKKGVCGLYRTITPEEIVTTHGASGANHHVFYSLIEPGDKVISISPTYQQLYSIPESFGARVEILQLRKENGYILDYERLKEMATPDTKLICLNNPNNPTGALMSREFLEQVINVARSVDAWILCDEVYRHLSQKDEWCESIADLYEKGISTSGMSKVFSLAGIRCGWIATHDSNLVRSMLSHRDYDLVSGGMIDEKIAGLALSAREEMLERNRSIVRENLAIVDRWIRSDPHFSYVRPSAGTTALIYYDFDMPSVEFCERMYHETGAFVTPGACFDLEGCFRLGYACEKDVLIKGLEAVSEFAKALE